MKIILILIVLITSSFCFAGNEYSLEEVLNEHNVENFEEIDVSTYVNDSFHFVIINAEGLKENKSHDFRLALMVPNEEKMSSLHQSIIENIDDYGLPICMEEKYFKSAKVKPGYGGSKDGYTLYQPLEFTCYDNEFGGAHCYSYTACSFVEEFY